ncbi:methyltransferase family protein [Pseudaquabacterium rugosum]|uniref:Isoprenylcysteine carboxylmethyltransferase family protein n=1 Tax=Pseudaquabacterium rugosum TaxID=2984194 RepID=A0ABU9BFD4_9BURK
MTFLIIAATLLLQYLSGPWKAIFHVPALGVLLFVAGCSLTVLARTYFTFRKTTLFVGATSSSLVCDGPFRFSRNPMYVGVVMSLLGVAVWFGTLPMLLAPSLEFLFLHCFHIPREEVMLRGTFGPAYVAYLQRVRRWL